MPPTRPRVVFYGLGSIGRGALKLALETRTVHVVAGIDPRKDLVGKDLGELAGSKKAGVKVVPTLEAALDGTDAEGAVHATESRVAVVSGQLRELIEAGLSVATSCEEMIFPWHASQKEAVDLDRRAKDRGVCLYGAGVNPGFVMDRLPVSALRATSQITAVRVRRVVDSLTRRPQLRAKTAAGVDPEEFKKLAAAGRLGHVGLVESALFVARALESLGHGSVRSTKNRLEPAVAAVDIATPEGRITKGQTAGVHQVCTLTLEQGSTVTLDLTIAVGAGAPGDTIEIDGDPPVQLVVPGGVAGDSATAAALVNGVIAALAAPAGIARE